MIVYAPRALRDLRVIAAYLETRSKTGQRRVLAAIKSSIDVLDQFPQIGRLVDDIGHRRMPVVRYPYVIFYRIAVAEVLILHIRHTSREPIDPAADL